MKAKKFCKTDPAMLAVLDEFDYLIAQLKQILESKSTSSVSLNHVLEQTE